jgi:8-oxo-dGTP diphosphatase
VSEPLGLDDAGNALLAFYPVAEETRLNDAPLPLARVAVWHADQPLLVFNRRRRCWELPGGTIEPAAKPRQAATRQLREETALDISDLAFVGYARFALGAERRAEYAALYTTRPRPATASLRTRRSRRPAGGTARVHSPAKFSNLDVVLGQLAGDGPRRTAARGDPVDGSS